MEFTTLATPSTQSPEIPASLATAGFAPNATYSRGTPTERGVDFPLPPPQGVDREARLSLTMLVLNFGHVDAVRELLSNVVDRPLT